MATVRLADLALGPVMRITGSGHVRLRAGVLRDQIRVVAKEISLTRADRENRSMVAAARLRREARMLDAAQPHRSIVQCFGMYEGTRDEEDGENVLGLVTREAPGGNLKLMLRDQALAAGSRQINAEAEKCRVAAAAAAPRETAAAAGQLPTSAS